MNPKLQVIIASTRPGRIGPTVANWFAEYARQHGQFDVELVDLADFNLPLLDEPHHPRAQNYQHEHTKTWSRSVDSADAYVFVAPEYNYSPTPSLINAFNYVYSEWNYKPCSFVSYGGLSGGLRATQAARLQATTLKMMPLVESVAIPMVFNLIDDNGVFHSNELIDQSATSVLDELQLWADGLKAMREQREAKAAA